MAIGRVMHENVVLFPDFDDIFREIKRDEFWEMQLFLQIPNLTKTDILEHFEETILNLATGPFGEDDGAMELDSLFFTYLFDISVFVENDSKPSYISEYINIVGQLFLAGYIDFGLCGLQDKQENLLSNQGSDKYQAWIHFRDNFFYAGAYYRDITEVREKYPNMSDDDYRNATWDTQQYWDRYRFWVARTEKGTQYFNEILAPKFYKKYKDLEVEIDSKDNIVRWIGEINRIK